jgi:hypothetical protein
MNKLPIFKMKIKEEVSDSENKQEFIALVDQPAVELEWFAFNDHKNIMDVIIGLMAEPKDVKRFDGSSKFDFSYDDERQILTGVALVADMPIYRKMVLPGDKEESEFYIVFDKKTVFDFVKKFMKNNYSRNLNLHHDDNMKLEDAFLFESIMVDSSRGISAPSMFSGVSDGSWIVSIQVEAKELWNKIKTEGLKGFSVQGYFGLDYVKTEDQTILEQIADTAKGL